MERQGGEHEHGRQYGNETTLSIITPVYNGEKYISEV